MWLGRVGNTWTLPEISLPPHSFVALITREFAKVASVVREFLSGMRKDPAVEVLVFHSMY